MCLGFGAITVNAASLFFSPEAGTYDVGKTFTVSIVVASDEALNAVGVHILFPPDKLQVVALSKGGSILTTWAQDPVFSNTAGMIDFEGVIPAPGYTGASGKVLSITFRAQQAGSAAVSIIKGSVLANDGNGTQILQNIVNLNVRLRQEIKSSLPAIPLKEVPTSTPPAATISIELTASPSPEIPVLSEKKDLRQKQFEWVISTLGMYFLEMTAVIVLFLGLVSLVWYLWHTFLRFRKKIIRKTEKSDENVDELLKELSFDTRKEIYGLEKIASIRKLSANEEQLMQNLRQHLKKIESVAEWISSNKLS